MDECIVLTVHGTRPAPSVMLSHSTPRHAPNVCLCGGVLQSQHQLSPPPPARPSRLCCRQSARSPATDFCGQSGGRLGSTGLWALHVSVGPHAGAARSLPQPSGQLLPETRMVRASVSYGAPVLAPVVAVLAPGCKSKCG